MKKWFFILTCVCLLSACQHSEPENPVQFTACASLSVARASAAAFTVNDKAYVLCGRDEKKHYLKDFWCYESDSDSWTQLPDVPFKPRVKVIAQTVNGKAYVGLGFNGKVYTDSCYLRDWWCYNPVDASWTRLADYPSNRTDAAVSFVCGSDIYVCFGFYDSFAHDVYRYSTADDKWELCSVGNIYLVAGGVACSDGSRFFAGTGYRTITEDCWYEFFPDTQEWIKRCSLPGKGRLFASSVTVGQAMYVLGGRFFGGTLTREKFYDDLLQYDADADEWLLRGYLPQGGRDNMVAFSLNGKGYFGLGEDKNGIIYGDLYRFE